MEYDKIITIERKNKTIILFMDSDKEKWLDQIVDVEVCFNRSKQNPILNDPGQSWCATTEYE